MNERDELATVIERYYDLNEGMATFELLAHAVLAAGYRKPRAITTVDELIALPDMSSVLDAMDGPLTRFGSWWRAADGAQFSSMDVVLPATVLYEPEPQP